MKVNLTCPECGFQWTWNYWCWIRKAQFHWLRFDKDTKRIRDYRRTKCPFCGTKSWIKRDI